jgi:hypothetical protein
MMIRTRILTLALVGAATLLPSLANAGGRTFNLATVTQKGKVTLRPGEKSITIRNHIGIVATSISRSIGGSTGTFAPVPSRLGKGRTQLTTATPGRYYVSPDNKGFEIEAAAAQGQTGPNIHPPGPGVVDIRIEPFGPVR